jgi:hypothetical protein
LQPDLHLDDKGAVVGTGTIGNSISCSALSIRKIRERQGDVLIEVQRGVLVYDDASKMLNILLDEDAGLVQISVPQGETADALQHLFDSLFDFDLDAHLRTCWVSSVPNPWERQTVLASSEIGSFDGQPVYLVKTGVVQAPRVIHAPDPEYSERARAKKLQGTTTLWAIIGADGLPKLLGVVQPLGTGLTTKAAEAVSNWSFHPATKNGEPVAVMLRMEINFRSPW